MKRGRPTARAVPGILRPRALAAHLGISLATIWRLRRRGDFPEPLRLSPGCVGWQTSVIAAWLKRRAQVGKAVQ